MPLQGSAAQNLRRAKRDISKGYPNEEGEVWTVDYENAVITVKMCRSKRMVKITRYLTSAPKSRSYGEEELPNVGDRVMVGYLNGEVATPVIVGYLRKPGYEEQDDELKPAEGEYRRKLQGGGTIVIDADGNVEITLPRTREVDGQEEEVETTLTIDGREIRVVNGQTIFNNGTQGVLSEAQWNIFLNWLESAKQSHPYGPTTGWITPMPDIKTTHDILVNEDWEPEEGEEE